MLSSGLEVLMSDLPPRGVRIAISFLHYKNLVLAASLLKTQLSSIQSDQHNGELVYISSVRVYLMHFFIRSIQSYTARKSRQRLPGTTRPSSVPYWLS